MVTWFKTTFVTLSLAFLSSHCGEEGDASCPEGQVSSDDGSCQASATSPTTSTSSTTSTTSTTSEEESTATTTTSTTSTTTSTTSSSSSSSSETATTESCTASAPAHTVYVTFFDRGNTKIGLMNNSTGCFVAESITVSGPSAYHGLVPDIALDSNGNIGLSFGDTYQASVYYAYKSNGSWTFTQVENVDISRSSLAFDSNDKVHMAYYLAQPTAYDLHHATNSSGSWQTATVDSTGNVGNGISLALDSSNNVHMSYRNQTTTAGGTLKYATGTYNSYTVSTVDSTDGAAYGQTFLGINGSNKPVITYHIANAHDLYFAEYTTSWATSAIDTDSYSLTAGGAINDNSGYTHVFHQDVGTSALHYRSNTGGSFSADFTALTYAEIGASPGDTPVCVDPDGYYHVFFSRYDSATSRYNIHYITNTSGSFTKTILLSDQSYQYPACAIPGMKARNNRP